MIGRLRGVVAEKRPPFILIDIAGVGYLVQAPLSTFEQVKENQEVTLYTHCLFTETESFIYGFLEQDELKAFQDLISVPGVGPKSALNLLSRFSPQELSQAIESEDLETITSAPKIGNKLASKIILELKGKLKFAEKPTVFNQAVTALCSLGLTRSEAVERLKGMPKDLALEELVKQALRK